MTPTASFKLNPEADVLDKKAPGVEDLLACLEGASPIQAMYCPSKPIRRGLGSIQWLDCQSSGSTGQPKTIRRTPESWLKSFDHANNLFGSSCRDHYAVFGSLGHSLSLFAVLEALHIGAKISILSGLSPKAQIQALKSRAVSVIYATPTQLKQLRAAGILDGVAAIPSIKRLVVGGGKLLATDRHQLSTFFPTADIVEFYGTSETSFVTLAGMGTPVGSVGAPYPGVEVKIEKESLRHSYGEICVRSPYVAVAYVGDSSKQIVNPNGFVSTGDTGYLDAKGFLFIIGRSDRMFTVSDVNVFPEVIEEAVSSLNCVDTCAVVPNVDDLRGNRAVCFVKPATQDCQPSEIRRHCRELLGEAHVPKEVRMISRFPVLPSGKPDMMALNAMLLARA